MTARNPVPITVRLPTYAAQLAALDAGHVVLNTHAQLLWSAATRRTGERPNAFPTQKPLTGDLSFKA